MYHYLPLCFRACMASVFAPGAGATQGMEGTLSKYMTPLPMSSSALSHCSLCHSSLCHQPFCAISAGKKKKKQTVGSRGPWAPCLPSLVLTAFDLFRPPLGGNPALQSSHMHASLQWSTHLVQLYLGVMLQCC